MSDALSPDEVRNIIFLGKTGVGKSATLNTLMGSKCFTTGHGKSVTRNCSCKEATILGMKVRLIDTPGVADTKGIDVPKSIDDFILINTKGIHGFVLVLSVSNRPTKEDIDVIDQLQKQLGPGLEEYLEIIVTRIDELEDGETTKGFLQSYASELPIVARCLNRDRVVGFDNGKSATGKQKQLEQFADTTKRMIKANGESFYTHAQLKKQRDAREKKAAEEEKNKKREKREMQDLKDRLRRNEKELSDLRMSTSNSEGFLSTAGTCVGNVLVATSNLAVGATGLLAAGTMELVKAQRDSL